MYICHICFPNVVSFWYWHQVSAVKPQRYFSQVPVDSVLSQRLYFSWYFLVFQKRMTNYSISALFSISKSIARPWKYKVNVRLLQLKRYFSKLASVMQLVLCFPRFILTCVSLKSSFRASFTYEQQNQLRLS